MVKRTLDGMRVAILVEDGFEESELTETRKSLDDAGATTRILSPHAGTVRGRKKNESADTFAVDFGLNQVSPDEFEALLLPGGLINVDALRTNRRAQEFVAAFDRIGKPIAAIDHAHWLMISAQLVEGRTLTSSPSLEDDIRNAGGRWLDQQVVRDDNWVTSRDPADLPAFIREMINMFCELRGPAEQPYAA